MGVVEINIDGPTPQPTILSQPFWDGCQQGKLRLQKCEQCGKLRFYPAEGCPSCGTIGGTWIDALGSGKLYSWIVVHKNPDQYWATKTPYVAGIVELDDQAQLYMPALVTGIAPMDVKPVMALEVWFDASNGQQKIPRWRPASSK